MSLYQVRETSKITLLSSHESIKGLFLELVKIPFHILKMVLNLVEEWSRSRVYKAGLKLVSILMNSIYLLLHSIQVLKGDNYRLETSRVISCKGIIKNNSPVVSSFKGNCVA